MDGNGNVYVAGESNYTWGTPANPHSGSLMDAFAAKLNSSGSLVWNTFMGGEGNDIGRAIAISGTRSVYVAGRSSFTWGTPIYSYTGSHEAFATKLIQGKAMPWMQLLLDD